MSVVTAFAPLSASPRQRRSVLLVKKGLDEKLISMVGGPPAATAAASRSNTSELLKYYYGNQTAK
jgi:hypothetical protein